MLSLLFFCGLGLGGFLGWLFYMSARRENLRLDEDKQMLLQERQIVFKFMHDLVVELGEGGDREDIYHRIVHAATQSTGAMSACFYELEGETLRGVAVEGLFPPQSEMRENSITGITRTRLTEQVLRSDRLGLGSGLVGSVAQSGVGALVPDATRDPRIVRHKDPALQIHSMIAVPVRFKEQDMGVLAVVNQVDGFAFTDMDYSLIESLSEIAAMALHNCDLLVLQVEKTKLDQELSLAEGIQGMLMPDVFPQRAELDIDARFMPAQKVGGDLYDVIELPEGRIGVAIADVSGKGIPASLLMAICQSNLRHHALQQESPSRVLSALNRMVIKETRKDMFVTMIYAVIDPAQRTITLGRAGHELPIILRRLGENGVCEAETPSSEGMALGLVQPTLFDSVICDLTLPFKEGDVLVLYTDGVTESLNAGGAEYSSGHLVETLRKLYDTSAKDINTGIIDSVNNHTNFGKQADDITLLVVRRN